MRRSAFSRVLYARVFTDSILRRGLLLAGLFHARRLALQLAQEVQLGAADFRRAQHLDLVDDRRVQREDALHALAERHLADGKGRARAAAVHPDHHALEHLDALLVPFAHLHVHFHGVPGLDRRALGELAALDGLNGIHRYSPLLSGGDPCTPPSSLHSAAASPAAPFRSRPSHSSGSRSGRCLRVRSIACSRRHFSISAWCPDSSTGGTFSPRNSAGRVYCGKSSSPSRAKVSPATDASSPTTPGISRATASTITSAGSSPPDST